MLKVKELLTKVLQSIKTLNTRTAVGASPKSASGSATVNSAKYYNICSLTLEKGYAWLILSHTGSGVAAEILHLNNLTVDGVSKSDVRTKAQAGGGTTNFVYVDLLNANANSTVTLRCYGYYTTSHTENGWMYAFPMLR